MCIRDRDYVIGVMNGSLVSKMQNLVMSPVVVFVKDKLGGQQMINLNDVLREQILTDDFSK